MITWYELEHPAWDDFVKFSRDNVSPGNGKGNLVEFYWNIFKKGHESQIAQR